MGQTDDLHKQVGKKFEPMSSVRLFRLCVSKVQPTMAPISEKRLTECGRDFATEESNDRWLNDFYLCSERFDAGIMILLGAFECSGIGGLLLFAFLWFRMNYRTQVKIREEAIILIKFCRGKE